MNKLLSTRSIRTFVAAAMLAGTSLGALAANPAVAHAATPSISISSETNVYRPSSGGVTPEIQVKVVGSGFAPGARVDVGLGYNSPSGVRVVHVYTNATQMGINYSGGRISATLTVPNASLNCHPRYWVNAADQYANSNYVVREAACLNNY